MRRLAVACLILAALDAIVALARAPQSNSSARACHVAAVRTGEPATPSGAR